MSEGGDYFGHDNPILDHDIDNDGDDDDEQEVNRTQPFQPGAASTPYHGGEQIQMQTKMHEQSGLPDNSYAETPLLSDFVHADEKKKNVERAYDYIKRRFPKVDLKKLGPIGFGKKQSTHADIVSYGPKGGETPIFKKDGSGFQKSFTDKFKNALGPSAEQMIDEYNNTLKEEKQKLASAEKQQREAQKIVTQKEKITRQMEDMKHKVQKVQATIEAIQEEHGSIVENEAELQRLKLLLKNHKDELEEMKKKLATNQKQVKKDENIKKDIAKESKKIDEIARKRNITEDRLNSTKTLDDLNQRKDEILKQNAEDQEIIGATDTSPSEIQAAETRVQERNEELARLQTQIAEREEAMPLRERIKEIFKKHGVTMTAIVIAAGVTIGTVVSSITKGLKATGKAMAGGLKELAAKLGSMLPGLIGQVAHFLYNTAAKAVGFLAEHTWLLILAVVAFLFEKYIKR